MFRASTASIEIVVGLWGSVQLGRLGEGIEPILAIEDAFKTPSLRDILRFMVSDISLIGEALRDRL